MHRCHEQGGKQPLQLLRDGCSRAGRQSTQATGAAHSAYHAGPRDASVLDLRCPAQVHAQVRFWHARMGTGVLQMCRMRHGVWRGGGGDPYAEAEAVTGRAQLLQPCRLRRQRADVSGGGGGGGSGSRAAAAAGACVASGIMNDCCVNDPAEFWTRNAATEPDLWMGSLRPRMEPFAVDFLPLEHAWSSVSTFFERRKQRPPPDWPAQSPNARGVPAGPPRPPAGPEPEPGIAGSATGLPAGALPPPPPPPPPLTAAAPLCCLSHSNGCCTPSASARRSCRPLWATASPPPPRRWSSTGGTRASTAPSLRRCMDAAAAAAAPRLLGSCAQMQCDWLGGRHTLHKPRHASYT